MRQNADIKLYDTYSRSVREFTPLRPTQVSLYACGPTVYDFAHIGNLRTYVFEDILRRTLEFNGLTVRHVVNITDVGHLTSDADTGEDKMEQGARRTGRSAWEIAEYYTEAFKEDLRCLNILEPTVWCRATDHIPQQIAVIQALEKKGFTYITSDGVYFDTLRLPDYGHLARLDVEGLRAGQRVDMAEKRNVTDFALWKLSQPDEQRQMEWDSPWGRGFPGWHTECVAMSVEYLGLHFDIHCGGEDHVPVHHVNEIAQAEACHGTRLADFWMHGRFLLLEGGKMAKSAGEKMLLSSLKDQGLDPLAYRFYCLGTHYRKPLQFAWDALDAASTALRRMRESVWQWGADGTPDEGYLGKFRRCVNNDLNTPQALALVWEIVGSDLPSDTKKATVLACDRVLGLDLETRAPSVAPIPEEIQLLAAQRERARGDKEWALADSLRDQISAAGYEVVDTADGFEVRPKQA